MTTGSEFAFFLHGTEELYDNERRFILSANDLALLNPNTRTCPIFRAKKDMELTRAVYARLPVLLKEGPSEENPEAACHYIRSVLAWDETGPSGSGRRP